MKMNHIITTYLLCLFTLQVQSQVIIQNDYTDAASAKGTLAYHLNIYNRITPINGFNAPHNVVDAELCIVRPLGGIARNGKAIISKDSYKWDEEQGQFYTDFSLVQKQLDGVFQEGLGIYHLVLDNPSWAFQRAADGSLLGDTLKVSTYGNAEPPRDNKVWAAYLEELMRFLVDTYGRDQMLKIQFGVGREIGTPTHWSGTKEAFFEFYRISIQAIHKVLPQAKVGTHLLWGSSKKSWAVDFVKWAKENEVVYDFLGVSFYPFYDKPGRTNFKEVYAKDFGVIKDLPEWNEKAQLEMHEFALIETLSKKGNAFKSADQAHQNAFMLGLMKMYCEQGMHQIFQWGDGHQYQPLAAELKQLEGNLYYSSVKSGLQQSDANYVDAIFTESLTTQDYCIMAYHYSADQKLNIAEPIELKATLAVEDGTAIKYRTALYGPAQDALQWSDWQICRTQGHTNNKSSISLKYTLPPFSFVKYELQIITE